MTEIYSLKHLDPEEMMQFAIQSANHGGYVRYEFTGDDGEPRTGYLPGQAMQFAALQKSWERTRPVDNSNFPPPLERYWAANPPPLTPTQIRDLVAEMKLKDIPRTVISITTTWPAPEKQKLTIGLSRWFTVAELEALAKRTESLFGELSRSNKAEATDAPAERTPLPQKPRSRLEALADKTLAAIRIGRGR